jgi:hypothetical protein
MAQQIIDGDDPEIIGQHFRGAITDHIARFIFESGHERYSLLKIRNPLGLKPSFR